MFHLWVRSEDDLPCMVHQTCTVWRYETKNTRPLIRVREIPWNEAHTAHSTPEEALDLLSSCWRIVHHVLTERLSIDGLRLRRPDWDRFPGADHTDVLDVVMPCGRVLQTVGAHYLGQHFSKVFDIGVNGENSYMTCIGVSTRALAAVLSMHGDDKGLIVPAEIAPIQVIVVPIINKATDQVMI
jgi:prolyl-tRNA synthetase